MKPKRSEPKYKMVRADRLVSLRRNPQYLSPDQMKSLKGYIEAKGFLVPIVVRRFGKKFEIISGNHRFMAGQELGLKQYPVVLVEATDEESKVMAMNLNTIHGEPPPELVAPFLADLSIESLKDIHFDTDMFNKVMAFDLDLGKKLKAMQIPTSVNQESRTNDLPDPRKFHKCPSCGASHEKL